MKVGPIYKHVSAETEGVADALVKAVKKFPLKSRNEDLLEKNDFWLAMDLIVNFWSLTDPDGLKAYHESTKGIKESRWDKRFAATKSKTLAWRARFPLKLIAIVHALFPNLEFNEDFGRRFVSRYRAFKIGEKSV